MNQSYQPPGASHPPAGGSTTFKFHALLADRPGAAAYRLWAYARILDPAGSGWAVVDVDRFTTSIGIGYSTFQRWITDTKFFRCVKLLSPRTYLIVYRSPKHIYKALQLSSFGMASYVDRAILSSRNALKIVATELTIVGLQKQALYAAAKNQPSLVKQGKIIDPLKILRSDPSSYSHGATVVRGYLKLEHDAPICPHTTLISISEHLGRSISTIQRRTNTAWRSDNGFAPLRKVRSIRKLNPIQSAQHQANLDRASHLGETDDWMTDRARRSILDSSVSYSRKKKSLQALLSTFKINPVSSSYQKVAEFEGGFYFLGGNVYQSELQPLSFKRDRGAVKRALVGMNK